MWISYIKIKATFRWQQDPIVDTSRFDQYVILTKFRKSEVAFSVIIVKWKTKIFTGVSAVIGVENRVIYYRVLPRYCQLVGLWLDLSSSYRISENSFCRHHTFWKWKVWKFSYSFRTVAIFYFINWIVVVAETIEGGKLFQGGNYLWKYGIQNYLQFYRTCANLCR